MNDPHVTALRYRVRHKESVDYGKAGPLAFEEDGFSVEVKDDRARFDLKQHYATEQEAREAVEPFIRDWEFDASLSGGPGCFRLEFDMPEIIDRRPTPGAIAVNASPARFHFEARPASVTAYRPAYPSPPPRIDSGHPDVQTLYERYKGFRDGNEPLTSFAYFCLTVVEQSVGPMTSRKRSRSGGRRRIAAASYYCIDVDVLQQIGKLSSTKGGTGARKREGVDTPLTDDERRFLQRATVRLIRRIAEHHAANGNLPTISVKDVR